FQDPGCVASGADLWISYGQGATRLQGAATPMADAVAVVHGRDGGAAVSWDSPVTAPTGAAGRKFLLPQISRTSSGALELAYYEGTDQLPGVLVRAHSSDGGSSFV